MALSKIISEEVLPQIDAALSDLATFDNEVQLAERAGLLSGPSAAQLQDLKARADKARTVLMGIKQVYFPGQ